tara:strand:+ start:1086 stop:1460 length:375 start_codon:yes stop_codon:yes gene_type:complete
MAFIIDTAFDSGLSYLDTNGTRLDICYTAEPTTYAQATSTNSCGNDTVNTSAPAAGSPSGRAVTVPAITAGSVTATQTAGWWALSDGASILLATGSLTATQAVTSGNTFTLDAITITLIDAVSV